MWFNLKSDCLQSVRIAKYFKNLFKKQLRRCGDIRIVRALSKGRLEKVLG